MSATTEFDRALHEYKKMAAALERMAERQRETCPDHLPSDMGTPTIGEES